MKLHNLIFLLFLAPAILNGQNLDEILQKHFEATGTENLKDVQSIQYYGAYKNHYLKEIFDNVPGPIFKQEVEFSILKNKGYLLKLEYDKKQYNYYGYYSWGYWKYAGSPAPEKWEPGDYDRLQIQMYLDLEGFLYNWKEKGMQVENLGNIELEAKEYYRIRVITSHHDTLFCYINVKNDLLEEISFMKDLEEGGNIASVTFSDYRKVEGVNIAFNRLYKQHNMDGSLGEREVVFKKIELNKKVNEDIFQKKNYQ